MGWTALKIDISVVLDSHGGDRQRRDQALYRDLVREIRRLLEDPKYQPLNPSGPSEEDDQP